MQTLESIIENLSDEELKEGFSEIVEWRETGVLKLNGIVRKTHHQFVESTKGNFPIYSMDTPFLFEIAKRHYR
jgi:recombinational DNA repair ATPase RecF